MKKFKKTFEDNKGKKSTRKGRNKGDLGNCEGFLPSCQHGMGQKCARPSVSKVLDNFVLRTIDDSEFSNYSRYSNQLTCSWTSFLIQNNGQHL
ncbi:hypothetical protein BK411_02650 [Vibrio splendidus]|nr:hypothetical protein BK411_02650 [Vibrio splendidus]